MGLFDGVDLGDDFPEGKINPEYEDPDKKSNDDEFYESLDDKKTKEQIRQLKIKNEKELRALVEKSLVVSIMGEIGQSIQNNFVDQAKRRANVWCNLLGVPSKERQIEAMIGDMIEEGINGVIADIEMLSQDGVFE